MTVIIANIVLFISLSVWTGIHLVEALPKRKRPSLTISRKWPLIIGGMIIISSSIPAFLVAQSTAEMFDEPLVSTLGSVLLEYRIGQSAVVVFILIVVTLLARFTLEKRAHLMWIHLIPTFGLFVASSWSAHAASLADMGFFLNVFHLMAASIWAGTLLTVGFFASKERDGNWLQFFQWFTPFAIGLVLTMIGTGIGMMMMITPDYTDSWLLDYGQLQVLKHLLFIPLVFYGFAHGFLMKKKLKRGLEEEKTVRSVRMEAVLLIVIFIVTGGMINQEPPHVVAETLAYTEMAVPAESLITTSFEVGDEIVWTLTLTTGLLIFTGVFILGLFIDHVGNARRPLAVPIYVFLFVICIYSAIMFGAVKIPA
ncbi:copper resistance D family protein [Geomicrobium sp. JSM 1781026]|uniref:copper resistance D family protein n=1 Tax=Geomicrobium sp. JSM 1781026 TaxID=3344580 RepID=UPI0035BEB841